MARAGILQEIIDIYKAHTSISDYNAQDTDYIKSYTTRANVRYDHGNRIDENGEIFYEYDKTFIVRYYVPVTEFDFIKWNGKFYRVLSIDKDRLLQQQTIRVELVNDNELPETRV